jgi:hypothetical protein
MQMTLHGYVIFGILVAYLTLYWWNVTVLLRSPTAAYSFVESQYLAQAVLLLPAAVFFISLIAIGLVGVVWAIGLLIASIVLALVAGLLSGSDDRFTRFVAALSIIGPYCIIAFLPALLVKYDITPSKRWYAGGAIVIVLIALKVGRNLRSLTYVLFNILAGGLMGGLAFAMGTSFPVFLAGRMQPVSIWLPVVVGAVINTFSVHLMTMFRPPFRNY